MDDGMKYFSDIGVVLNVSACCITFILIVGTYYDAAKDYYYPKEKVVSYVDCSVNIVNMAKKLNITLIGRCKQDET